LIILPIFLALKVFYKNKNRGLRVICCVLANLVFCAGAAGVLILFGVKTGVLR
jgi:hypothetical protein